MTTSDHNLLREVTAALGAEPFAATVMVFGQRLSLSSARAIERMLLRLRVAERRSA